MRAVLQRVTSASVTVDQRIVGAIGHGWLVLVAIEAGDTVEVVDWMAEKCVHLRAFSDEAGKMNRSVLDVSGSMLIVSQFTLAGDCSRGRRPSFDRAAPPTEANLFFEQFCDSVRRLGVPVQTGIFQADMQVALVNDGPVTLVVDRSPPAAQSKSSKASS
jgi:D-tyrosyl-tRNA(Tyr) deacylase